MLPTRRGVPGQISVGGPRRRLSSCIVDSATVTRLNEALEGRYRIERELGEGGMATVYLAQDGRHNRRVALKVLKPTLAAAVGAERFLAEIETTARLQHPHILPLFDSGEADGFLFYVMPYVEGESLQERLDRTRQLPVAEAIGIATAVAHALQAAHDAGVVHRDVKPGNILLSRGQPLVADFGIARAVEDAGGGARTATGVTVGTPRYMSPEQATGDRVVGPSSDVFGLASVLFEMLVGEPPYSGPTMRESFAKLFQGAPVSAAALRKSTPPHVDGAIRKALEPLPADRFGEAREFAEALSDPSFRYGKAESASVNGHRPWRLGTLVFGVTTFSLALLWAQGPGGTGPLAGTLRLSILLPEPQVGSLGTLGLSRDGSMLVYEGPSENATHQLWLRRWSDSHATPLPGTESGVHGSFSPDGREIAYLDRGRPESRPDRLMVTSIDGGLPRVLHEPIRGYPHWGRDGYVYYMDVTTEGISRIPAGGGAVEPITERQVGEQTPHYNPYHVPAGNAVLFVVNVDDTPRIRAVDLATREITPLGSAGVRPHYASSGHLLYLTPGGDLTAAPFDADRMEVTGAGVPVVRGLRFDVFYSPLVLSENGTLLYVTASSSPRFQPVWVDREGAATPIDPEWTFDPGRSHGLSLSPDGTRLAVSIMGGAAEDIWIKELPRGPLTRLTEGTDPTDPEIRPRWTRDGRVTYVSGGEGPVFAIHARPGDGTGTAELLLVHERPIEEAVLSGDGEWLIARVGRGYSVAGRAGGRDVVAIRPGRDTVPIPLMVTGSDEKAVVLSPDGRWLAYESDETGRDEIYVRPFPGVDAGKWPVSVNGGIMPLWSRSGDELFYVNAASEMVEARISTAPSFAVRDREILFSIGPDFLFGQSDQYTNYDITPDDERFVMLRLAEPASRGELILVTNWLHELEERVPN